MTGGEIFYKINGREKADARDEDEAFRRGTLADRPLREEFASELETPVPTDVRRFRQLGQNDFEHRGDVFRGEMRLERGFVRVLLDEQELRWIFLMDEELVGETPGLRACRLDERFELLPNVRFLSGARNSTSDDVQRF